MLLRESMNSTARRTVLRGGKRWVGETRRESVSRIDFGKVRVDTVDRGDLMQALANEQRQYFKENKPDYFKDVDIENPKTMKEWIAKKFLAIDMMGSKYRHKTYGTRMGMTTMNHINNPDWAVLFGVQEMYLEVSMWLWAIHMWLIQKRLWVIPESAAIGQGMHSLYTNTSSQRLATIYDTNRERSAVQQRIEKAFHPDCQYRDALLFYALYRNSPFEHREEVPMFAWYTLVQYIRLHLAVFDRIPNSEFKQGLFYFYHPLDPSLFEPPSGLDSPRYVSDLLLGKRGAQFPEGK